MLLVFILRLSFYALNHPMIEPAAIHRTSVAHIRLFRKLIQSKAFLASHIQYGMQNTNLTRMPHGVYYKIGSPYLEWLLGNFASEWLSGGDWAVCVQHGGLRLYVSRYL